MKKVHMFIAVLLALLVSSSLFSAVCIADEKPIVMKLADFVPSGSFLGQEHQWWADEVEKRTQGRKR